jgi:hypothetical protein
VSSVGSPGRTKCELGRLVLQTLVDEPNRGREVSLLNPQISQIEIERPVVRLQDEGALERRRGLFGISQLAPCARSYDFGQHDSFDGVCSVAEGEGGICERAFCERRWFS